MRGTTANGVALGTLPSTQADQGKSRARTQVAHRGLGGILGEAGRGRGRGGFVRSGMAGGRGSACGRCPWWCRLELGKEEADG
jgi:hypothetical protein